MAAFADPTQVLSLAGASLVLAAYVANLFRRLDSERAPYAALNALGSALLSYTALVEASPWGIVLIEVAWTAISLVALGRALSQRRTRRDQG
ncbi:CBU_0592 family membrane protein [Candidatus Methylocalor cossyra]|uniref:CBU-0592-like domain-containing protein n=1 Tax=Candidatus Methylocalor cossyra TaxID=3108543 RepID=A0ABM9NLM8_9GAMM